MKLDLTTGDAMTPREIEYTYPCIFSKENIKIMVCPLETILAEWIVLKKVDTKNKKSTSICTSLPSQMVKAYC